MGLRIENGFEQKDAKDAKGGGFEMRFTIGSAAGRVRVGEIHFNGRILGDFLRNR
jgi:hypothetical protein